MNTNGEIVEPAIDLIREYGNEPVARDADEEIAPRKIF